MIRRWLIDKLMTPEIKDSIYKEIWEKAKSKGVRTVKQTGKSVRFTWSNADEQVYAMSYGALADDEQAFLVVQSKQPKEEP